MAQISHRDQLLAGAIECLRTKGYSRTTARDIAKAADANLASIGYHFGSKEALLNEAIMRACEEWTTRLGQAALAGEDQSPLGQMATSWMAMLGSFEKLRPVLVGFVEAVGQSVWSADLREDLAAHYRRVREQVAAMVVESFGENAEGLDVDPRVIASFLIAVCDGLMLQWLLSPDDCPNADELVSSLWAGLAGALREAGVPN
jgi:AcrR family transcriptional regulator